MTTEPDLLSRIRIFVYTDIADIGVPPTVERIAAEFSVQVTVARDAIEELARTRQVILDPATREVWMAGPFSAVPTRFRVHGTRVSWWANCAWDMLGIPAALRQNVRVDATCADCGEVAHLDVDAASGPESDSGLVHILLPANRWYHDIGFT